MGDALGAVLATMNRMARIPVIAAALLATLVVALPASGAGGVSTRGVVVTLSANTVSVQAVKGIVTTCALTPRSPSLDGYATGDRVQVQCARTAGHLVLTRVRRLTSAPSTPPNDTTPVTFGGAITALGDASISLHDGDRDLTCSIDATSPSTSGFTVGQHVKVACVGGVLARIVGPATVPARSPRRAPPRAPRARRTRRRRPARSEPSLRSRAHRSRCTQTAVSSPAPPATAHRPSATTTSETG